MKLLLVEDNEQLNKALTTVLKRKGYVVDSSFDGEDGLFCINNYNYDVVILDIMLPKINGLELLHRARNNNIKTPVLLLTAKSSIEDKIKGLDYGADDYLAKPFDVEELLARIRALARRAPNLENNDVLSYGDLSLDTSSASMSCGSANIILSKKELQIMQILMKSGGSLVSSESIIDNVWNSEECPIEENVYTFISYLRTKMKKINTKTSIKSIRFQGYYLEYKK